MIAALVLIRLLLGQGEGSRIESTLGGGTSWTYVWVQGGKKVGQSEFRLEKDTSPAGGAGFLLSATRTYDREGVSHRASSRTEIAPGGEPRRYEESLDVTTLKGRRGEQKTALSFSEGKARLKYVQNGTAAVEKEVEMPRGAFLLGSQAVEHWAVLLATLEPGAAKLEAQVYYPDFGESFALTFKKAEEQRVKVGAEELKTTRHTFQATKYAMQGSVWLDEKGRMVQIEFPNARDPGLTLRVTLATAPPR